MSRNRRHSNREKRDYVSVGIATYCEMRLLDFGLCVATFFCMSLPIHVDDYSGYTLNQRPTGFELDGTYYRIYALEAQWRTPSGHYFKVRADGKRVILRYDESRDEWTLESAYDGRELFARAGIQLVAVDSAMIRAAEKQIESCEGCNRHGAEIPFQTILDRVTGHFGSVTNYILEMPAKCPNCSREIFEKTLVEPI